MESTEEELSSFTIKGRRTKRQRSLLALSASCSSSYRGGGGSGGATGCSDSISGSSSSASPSNDDDAMGEVTTEEEDMANCLILLSHGIEKKRSSNLIKSKINNNNNITSTITSNNSNSISLYECKTCNKTFPSFQALGGHRTSHKKMKPPSSSTLVPLPDHHDEHREMVVDLDVMEFTSNKKSVVQSHDDNNKATRVHVCSICGSEFPSGQALGGHMRRHRAAVPPSAATVVDTGGPSNFIMSLDLNLPAPDDQDNDDQQVHGDDHYMETKFVHVLPRPVPLVDCHY